MVECLYCVCYQVFFIYFFFFQAEDGIRDGTVTGVQTCALPISRGEEGVPLIPQVVGHVRVHVREEGLDRGGRGALCLLDRPGDFVSDLLFEPGLSPVVPPAGMLEVPPVAGDRISRAPQGDLRFIPIPRRVVTRGM